MERLVRSARLAPVGLGVLMLLGCSDSSETSLPTNAPPAIAAVMQAAIDAGVSEAQLDILNKAIDEGRDVNEEDYRQATEAAMQCIRDSGMTGSVYADEGFDTGGIYLSIGVVVADPEDEVMLAMLRDCESREQDFVEAAYQTRASAVEWLDALFEEYKPALLECIRAKGIEISDDVSIDEFFTIEYEANPDEFETRCAVVTGFEDEINGM